MSLQRRLKKPTGQHQRGFLGEKELLRAKEALVNLQRQTSKSQIRWESHTKRVWAAIPTEDRVAITSYVFSKLAEQLDDGGSFRHLIYDRLGLGPDAYAPLLMAGGMSISNALSEIRDVQWRSFEKSQPRPRQKVFVVSKDGNIYVGRYARLPVKPWPYGVDCDIGFFRLNHFAYWMPLISTPMEEA